MITVTKDEVKRLHILAKVQEGSLTMREAAAVVGVTVRQLRRLRRRVESEGERGKVDPIVKTANGAWLSYRASLRDVGWNEAGGSC